jgi:hypothetical protein
VEGGVCRFIAARGSEPTIIAHAAETPCQNFSALGNIFPHFELRRKTSAFE